MRISYSEIQCKTALSRSLLNGIDYSLNPYMGCEHSCIYCYAPYSLHYKDNENWGSFVKAKVNIPIILEKELKKTRPGIVGISTVVDPYQKAEEKFCLTKKCLDVLLPKDFPVCIQTKSPLVLRDLSLIKDFKNKEIGLTITTLDDALCASIEPGAPPVSQRILALKKISEEGIPAWAFVGPVIPGIINEDKMTELLSAIKDAGAYKVFVDRLRLKPGMWNYIGQYLKNDLEIYEACKKELFGNGDLFLRIRAHVKNACEDMGLACEFNY